MEEEIWCLAAKDAMASELLSAFILYCPRTVKWGVLITSYVKRELMKLNVIMFAM